ncbi:hypothetical protein [Rhodoferax sp.]|uniref:hypothetical protein n=1 Tax=Rhodoferax sp. TaxID=50421 RepID=UPI0026037DF3|nr:hypothetical protein [Rhodoferax sp.]MDD3937982.1 hypothetical protein [Rhodoferax sp.]
MLEQIEASALQQLGDSLNKPDHGSATLSVNGKEVQVRVRRMRSGKVVYGYGYYGVRMERTLLLQLLCSDPDCPQCKQTQSNWRSLHGEPIKVPEHKKKDSYSFKPLFEEAALSSQGRKYIARPAVLSCLTPCPANVHPATILQKQGWDLFDAAGFVAGGQVTDPKTGFGQPLFPSIATVQTWLDHQST